MMSLKITQYSLFYKNQLFSAEAQLLLFQKHLIIIETQFVLIVFSFYYTEVWYKLNFYILLSYVILKNRKWYQKYNNWGSLLW